MKKKKFKYAYINNITVYFYWNNSKYKKNNSDQNLKVHGQKDNTFLKLKKKFF